MDEYQKLRAFAALTEGIPSSPGLGPIAARVRAQGLPTLDDDHARLLAFLAGERGTLRVLVTGRSAGHAAACVAHVAPRARVAIAAPGVQSVALIASAAAPDRVRVVAEDAMHGLDQGEEAFDLIHVDEEVSGYRRLLDRAMTRTAVQGRIVFHGLPADGAAGEATRAFCGYLLMHPQLQATVLAIGSGLALARKAQPLVTDLGGPY